jgi:hypothetical protein
MCSELTDEFIGLQEKFTILANTAISKDIKVFRISLCRQAPINPMQKRKKLKNKEMAQISNIPNSVRMHCS